MAVSKARRDGDVEREVHDTIRKEELPLEKGDVSMPTSRPGQVSEAVQLDGRDFFSSLRHGRRNRTVCLPANRRTDELKGQTNGRWTNRRS